jgi:pyruvate dehydrogenase E2 component (dihydrolipoamide acetyltransferase)
MAEIIRMPRLSDTMEEGNIVSWLKKVGDSVKSGDVLAEVETDKATMELESYFNGTLLYIGVPSGPVSVDGIIAIIGNSSDDVQKILSEAGAAPNGKTQDVVPPSAANIEQSTTPSQSNTKPSPSPAPVAIESSSVEASRVKASPLAKSIAQDLGIPISAVKGSGENGRIIKKDVETFAQNSAASSSANIPDSVIQNNDFTYGDVPVSQMRKTIARRLGESKFSAPHFYLTIEVNMDRAVEARQAIIDASGTKVSFNDMVIRASANALRKHPVINSSWYGDKITYNRDINIGVAVAVEDGLLVPVINHADLKTLSSINQEVKDLAAKAKAKKLSPAEMSGNTFTISNLGMFDIEEFTAIINPPDACILAVGSIIKKPIVKNDTITIGNMMKLTLSCDHRVVDGASGAQFLQTLKAMLENPLMMLV